MYEGKLRNGNGAYHDASTEFERKNVNQGASICPRRKKGGKQSNPTCIAMRHDKIISSTQIHAVCFFRLIAKADLSCFISRTGEGSTREAEKVEEEREGGGDGGRKRERRERARKETCDSPIRAQESWRSLANAHAYASPCATGEGLFSVRERPTTLYIFISRALVFDGRKKTNREGRDGTRRKRTRSAVSSLTRDNGRGFS